MAKTGTKTTAAYWKGVLSPAEKRQLRANQGLCTVVRRTHAYRRRYDLKRDVQKQKNRMIQKFTIEFCTLLDSDAGVTDRDREHVRILLHMLDDLGAIPKGEDISGT